MTLFHSVPKEAEKYLSEEGTMYDVNQQHPMNASQEARKLKYKRDYKKN